MTVDAHEMQMMNAEYQMTTHKWAEEPRVFAAKPPCGSVSHRHSNCRDTVTTIAKHLNTDGSLMGFNPSIVASPMRQLARTSFSSPNRAIPSSPNKSTVSSPNGAKHPSPGHRPGSRSHIIFSPEGAAHLRATNPPVRTPLQGSGSWGDLFLGRCPRLAWIGPLALKNRNANMEGRRK